MILQCRLSIARDHRSRGSPNSSTLIFGMRSGTRQLRTFFNAESPSVIQLFVWAVRSNDKVKLLFSFAGRGAVGAAVHWEADGRHAPYVVQSCRNVHTKLTTHSQLSSPSAQFRGDRVVLYDLFSAIHLVRVHLDLTSMTNANEITLTVMNAFFFLDCCYFTIADSTGFSALPHFSSMKRHNPSDAHLSACSLEKIIRRARTQPFTLVICRIGVRGCI